MSIWQIIYLKKKLKIDSTLFRKQNFCFYKFCFSFIVYILNCKCEWADAALFYFRTVDSVKKFAVQEKKKQNTKCCLIGTFCLYFVYVCVCVRFYFPCLNQSIYYGCMLKIIWPLLLCCSLVRCSDHSRNIMQSSAIIHIFTNSTNKQIVVNRLTVATKFIIIFAYTHTHPIYIASTK